MAARQSKNADDPNMTSEFDTLDDSLGTTGSDGAASVADALSDTVSQVQQKAGETVDQVKEQAGQVTDQLRQQTKLRLTDQKDSFADSLKSVALAVRQTGQNLREDDQATIAQYADQAAERIEQFQRYIGRKDLAEITTDIEQLARRQPVLFIGGSLALGILAARFLKSSGKQATAGSYAGGGTNGSGDVRAKVYGLEPGAADAARNSYDAATGGDGATDTSGYPGIEALETPEKREPAMQQQTKDDRSLGELFGDLTRETTTLVRQEVELAKSEVTQKATRAAKHVGFIGAGAALAYAGLLAIIAAVVLVLGALGLPMWLSALIVGVIVVLVGYFLIQKGRAGLNAANLMPQQTVQTLKEDAEWAKQQTK